MSHAKKLCVCALCVALCCVLPPALHALGLGQALSPLHFPVLLCALVCGWSYGGLCGLAGPLLSCLINAMPGPAQLVHMVPELMVYGVAAGLLFWSIRTGRTYADLYLALVPAMVLGRVVGGLVQAAVYLSGAKGYSLTMWVSGYFVGTLPGIVIQLVLIPAIYLLLERARFIPGRYPEKTKVSA